MHNNEVRSVHDVYANNPDTLEFHRKNGTVYFIAAGETKEGKFKYSIITDTGQFLRLSEEDYDTVSDAIHAGMKEAQNI